MKQTSQTLNFCEKPICIGTGLVALDVIIDSVNKTPTQFLAGGSCGNVLTILSYLGWSTFPLARLSNNVAAELLLEDFKRWQVNEDLLSVSETGSTPIIIHRILKDSSGLPKHKFEFKNPEDGKYLPSYKPFLAKSVSGVIEQKVNPHVFYFDRINRGAIDLAKAYKAQGAIIFFEPSSNKDLKGFNECIAIADVVKFSDDRIDNYDTLFPTAQAGLEIMTLGKEGLKFRRKDRKKWVNVEGFSIENVIDAAGAGDWCTSGIIMSLFNERRALKDLLNSEITSALKFGQVLSALNCTFEGARGLMYNIKSNELLLYVQHILSSNRSKIPQRKAATHYEVKSHPNLKISSLFAAV